jgi:hypothetical protein
LAVLGLFAILAVIASRRLPKVQPNDPRFAEWMDTTERPASPAEHP